jgi:anaerobic magnesium-protoporphyrin IX monomethyl ester cyclase
MNFLLIYPTQITEAPITLAMLGAVLRQEGVKVFTCVNTFKHPLSVQDFVAKAKEVKADVVGISMLTFRVLFVYEIVMALKENGFTVVLGGAHPTDCPEEGIRFGADIVVQGEGEGAIQDIAKGLITNGIIPKRPRLEVSKLPLPDLSVFDYDLFRDDDGFVKGFHRVYTSRGCPGACTFCDWRVFGQKFKEYDVEAVVEEIKRRRDVYGLRSFSIADDCFTVNPERVFHFCSLIKGLGVQWRANSRANLVTEEMLQAMKDSGCHSIAFGLESGDPETLHRIGKGVKLEDNLNAPRMAHEAGLEVYGCLMTGFPWENEVNIGNQIRFVHDVWDYVTLFQVSGSLMPFPGAAIYRQYASKFGFEEYWLRPEYQEFGIQVYQNSPNPYKVSTFYQRVLFDDTYIRNEYFFKYSREYKLAVRELVKEIGRHNLQFMFSGQPRKQRAMLSLARLSMFTSDVFPRLEKVVGGVIFNGRSSIERIRDKRRGIAKSYTNPN